MFMLTISTLAVAAVAVATSRLDLPFSLDLTDEEIARDLVEGFERREC